MFGDPETDYLKELDEEHRAAFPGRYETRATGPRAEHTDGVVRDKQEGKTLYPLMFPKGVPMEQQLIVRVAELYTRGGSRYGNRNWENSRAEDTLEHHAEALWRHFMKFFFDVQDGEDHAAAIVWNINAVELTRKRIAEDAADEYTKLSGEIEQSPLAGAMKHFNKRFEEEADYQWFTWDNGDRLTEADPDEHVGSWIYGAGGDVWYLEESHEEPWPKGIDRSARSLKNLMKEFGPLIVTRGKNKGWTICPDGSVEYGVGS